MGLNGEAHLGILDIFSPSDPELVKRTLTRIDEQDTWNDVFSTKLIELLDNIDGLKKDIRERMRRIESVTIAESMLLDEAARTETLNTKLAETRQVLDLARQEFQGAQFQYKGAAELREEAEVILADAEMRFGEAKSLLESAAIEYRKATEVGNSSAHAYMESERQFVFSAHKFQEAGKIADLKALEIAAQTASLDKKLAQTETATDAVRQEFQAAKVQYKRVEGLCSEAMAGFIDSGSRYREAKKQVENAETEYRRAEERGKSSAHAYDESERQLILSAQKLQEAGESTLEAKSLLDMSKSQLDNSRIIEEKAATDLRSAEQVLESSKQRMIAASEVFQRAERWVVSGAVVSWIAVMWIVWSTFHTVLPLWEPCIATAFLLLGGTFVLKGVKHEA